MNRIMTGLLLAASTLLPASIAQAQDQNDHPRHDHHGGQGGHPDGARPAPQPNAAPQPNRAQPAQTPRDSYHPQPNGNGGARFQGRPQGDVGSARHDDAAGRFPANGGQGGDPGQFRNGGDPRFQGHGGQGGYRAQPGQPGYQTQQQGRPFYPNTGGQGGYRPQRGQPGFRPGGPGFAPGAPRWGNSRPGGGWTRGWRDDHRYDWHSYRSENRFVFNLPHYYAPRGWSYGYRRFDVGVSLSFPLFGQDYWIDDPYDYRLPPAYEPYQWVRYYNDALLVDTSSGEVVDAVYGIFY